MLKKLLKWMLACIVVIGILGFISYKDSYMYSMVEAQRAAIILENDGKSTFSELSDEKLSKLNDIYNNGVNAAYLYSMSKDDIKKDLKYKLNEMFAKVHYVIRVLPHTI